MNCSCGRKLRTVETRCDGITTYRLRWCPKCFKEYATKESLIDLDVGKKMCGKILYQNRIKNNRK